jgi:flagellar basal-body rod protein FlgB
MFQSLFDNSTIPLLQMTAAFAERRHEVLAGNIANISTPDYRTRDLAVEDFRRALREAIASRTDRDLPAGDNWSYRTEGNSSSTGKTFPAELFHAVQAPPRTLTFQDGNNRSIEQEAMELTKNSLLQSVAIELMNVQMNRLAAVISERP